MKNWKTSLSGVIFGAATILATTPGIDIPKEIRTYSAIVAAVGGAAGLHFAADKKGKKEEEAEGLRERLKFGKGVD